MLQGIREPSLLPKYPISLRYAEGDRVFRYSKADLELATKYGAANADFLHFMNTAVAALAGDTELTVVIDAAEASYAQNQFRDGYITIHTTIVQTCLKIRGNDVSAGGNVVLHLAEALMYDVALPTFVELHANKYNGIVPMTGAGYQSVVVVPCCVVPAGYHFWGQTWGDCLCTAGFGGGIGGQINERSVYFQDDGGIGAGSDLGVSFQYAGFMIPQTWRDGAPADNLHFMLQLAP